MSTWLTIKQLTYHSKNKSFKLDINNLSFNKNITALTGKNGTGKTTLFNIILGLITPTEGNIKLDKSIQSIDFIDQSLQLLPHLTVEEYCFLGAYFKKRFDSLKDTSFQTQLDNYLNDLALSTYKQRFIAELSRGQQQRVALIKCLLSQPDLILADEPTSAQDTQGAELIYTMLQNYSNTNQTKILIIEHNPTLFNKAATVYCLTTKQFITPPKEKDNAYVFTTH